MNAINVPKDGLAGFKENFRADFLSGFLVFLIALPLCIGISLASDFGAFGGLFTAIIGGIIVTFFSGAKLAIKGPAAGLIPIAFGCMEAFKADPTTAPVAYQCALAVVVVAGVIQILFGLLRAGVMSDFFPNSAVHGMLASIGLLIIATQAHSVFGQTTTAKTAVDRLAAIPHSIANLNPEIALIGLLSLAILFTLPRIKHPLARKIPAPLLVLFFAVPLGFLFDLQHAHMYTVAGHEYGIVPKDHIVQIKGDMFGAITTPIFTHILSSVSLTYIALFALIGSIESTASAKAIDTLDPYKRKSNFNKDLLALGIGNTAAGLVGGLPMISEIVRSSANINNGARTRWANFWHGIFLLAVVAAVPWAIAYIPRAALGAMLVFTGLRLASWKELRHMAHVGKEQLIVFLVTIVVTIGADLLVGIVAGVVTELVFNLIHRGSLSVLFKPSVVAHDDAPDTVRLEVQKAATFTNYIGLKRRILAVDPGKHVVVDLSKTTLVDANVMEYFHELTEDFARMNRKFVVTGLERHTPMSSYAHAGRKLAA